MLKHTGVPLQLPPLNVRCLAAAMLAIAGCLFGSRMSVAETRALVVGINDYQHISSLHGAVADAEDIAQSLRQAGVSDLTLLLNRDVTRARLTADWQALLNRAKSGDRLIFTFAGHGTQQPERIAGSEADGKDEVLMLSGVSDSGPGTQERILDDELNQWFTTAGEQGVEVLFVADSCHSGTLTRGIDPRAGRMSVRYTAYSVADDMLELELPSDDNTPEQQDLPGLTFLAAGQEHEQVPEFDLFDSDGRRAKRGALSWAFARAIEGAADQDSDGRLSREELHHFVRANVRAIAESRQTPNLLPIAAENHEVLSVADTSTRSGAVSTAWPQVRLQIRGLNEDDKTTTLQNLDGVVVADASDAVDLVLDMAKREAISGQGDVLASDLSPSFSQNVIDTRRGLERLKLERLGDRLSMRVLPNDTLHHRGQKIAFEIKDIRLPHLAFFSLSGDGTVHFHYPFPDDPATVQPGEPISVDFEVTPPFGTDYIIAVTSTDPLDDLISELKTIDGQRAAKQAVVAVLNVTRQGQRQLGIQGMYTAP
jgi:uncharacterized caspase-like protein